MFEPQLIPKHARRLAGFDDTVLALYGCGLPVREIQKSLAEISAIDVSPDLISEVTDAAVADGVARAAARAAVSGGVLRRAPRPARWPRSTNSRSSTKAGF